MENLHNIFFDLSLAFMFIGISLYLKREIETVVVCPGCIRPETEKVVEVNKTDG